MNLLGIVLLSLLLAYIAGCVYFFRRAMRVPKPKPDHKKKEMKPVSEMEAAAHEMWHQTRAWLATLPGKEEWTVSADDGKTLHAAFVPNGDSKVCALLAHGWHGRNDDMAAHGKMLYEEKGYAMLLPQQRAHGQSEGHYTTMGFWESRDMLKWIDSLVKRGVKQIVVLGVSMGAGTVMMLSSLDLPKEVKCLVEDCGYTSVREEFLHVSADMLGAFRFLSPLLVAGGSLLSKLFLGCWYHEIICERSVARAKRPMLFIHGTNDTFVPYAMLRRNYDACTAEKSILSVPNAAHAMSLCVAREEYEAALREFVDQYITL